MIGFQHPRLPLPAPLMMSEGGSFAHYTYTNRLPAIVRRIAAENPFTVEIQAELARLIDELFNGTVRNLHATEPDAERWQPFLAPFVGATWIEMPWLFAELYFFRRILEATQYFRAADGHLLDPFHLQKQAGLESALSEIQKLCYQRRSRSPADLLTLLYGVLWGNQADLSLRPNDRAADVQAGIDVATAQAHILVDDSVIVCDRLEQRGDRIDLIADNAGFELVCDLLLIDFLLSHHLVDTVYLHLKSQPVFVSDATIADLHYTLDVLAADVDRDVQQFAADLHGLMATQRLQVVTDPFWTDPLSFWQMPPALQQDLSQSSMVLVKGDANYRRLLGDRHWAFTTPFADIVSYICVPLAALRTLKSEVVAGLAASQLAALHDCDRDWLTNGKWGLIQIVN